MNRPAEWVVFDRAPCPAWNGSTAGATMVPAGHYVAHESCARRAGKVDGEGFPVRGFATAPTWGEPRACSECSGELR